MRYLTFYQLNRKVMPVYIPPVSRRKFLATTFIVSSGYLFGFGRDSQSFAGTPVDPDYFVLIADPHIDQSLSQTREGENMADNLMLIVQRILTDNNRLPAGVIINGDAANRDGNPLEYANLKNILAPLSEAGIPVYITMGNHDRRDTFFAAFPDQKGETPIANGRRIDIIETPKCYLILLDTLESVNKTPGVLGPLQRSWLIETLSGLKDKPVILIGHHYPWPNIQDGNPRGLRDYDQLLEICHANRQVKAYIFGHSHRWDLRKDEDLHLVNQPTSAGTGASQPTAYLHAWFQEENIHLELDCIDRTGEGNSKWQGVTTTLAYRPDDLPTLEGLKEHGNDAIKLDNYPNPFSTTTIITYRLNRPAQVVMQVFSSDGRLVKTVTEKQMQEAGLHQATFDATGLPAGCYICRLNVNGTFHSGKMVVIKD